MTPKPRVLVTGADGLIGRTLRSHLADDFDLTYLTRLPADFPSLIADITDMPAMRHAMHRMDAVVHLAAASATDAAWGEVLSANIVGTYNVFEAARQAGVPRVVFASTNHVVGMYEVDGAPELYAGGGPVYGIDAPLRPDSLYGTSKIFGEAVARLYADRYGLASICLRIGAVREDDDPNVAAVPPPFGLPTLTDEQARQRLRAVWLSKRDCAQLVRRALEANVRWAVVYGISANANRFWDLEPARTLLGYEPLDATG